MSIDELHAFVKDLRELRDARMGLKNLAAVDAKEKKLSSLESFL